MKSLFHWGRLFLIAVALLVVGTDRPMAQSFTNFYNFQADSTNQLGLYTNQYGATPTGPLLLLGNTLYGATIHGGTNGTGCIYAVSTNGTGYSTLHIFSAVAANTSGFITNNDGADPGSGLIVSGTTLFGTTWYGGINGEGTIFSIGTNGTGFTILHAFAAGATNASLNLITNSDGGTPVGGLTLFSSNMLFGAACYGGANGSGTVYGITTNGLGFTNLYNFSVLVSSNNSDGANPYASLLLAGSKLYGTAESGGTNGNGTIFAVNTNGTGFTNLHNFSKTVYWTTGPYPNLYTNSDGANSRSQIIMVNNTLYGTATYGGLYGFGTVFTLATNGAGFTALHEFAAGAIDFSNFGLTNSDGAWPQPGVIFSGGTLYGDCEYGGLGLGTVFSIATNNDAFTVLHYFPSGSTLTIYPNLPNSDGAYPQTLLLLSNGALYSSATYGGLNGSGDLYGVTISTVVAPPIPVLTITPQMTNAVVTWPTNSTGYTLQSTTNLALANWSAVSPLPVVTGTNYVVTNAVPGQAMFYRLIQ
jgi:uncharacterized repeat protein (TIGR03803 family)